MIALSKKVCLLGDFAVGKTSLVRRFIYSRFDEKYISTIGVNVSRKTINVIYDNQVVELTIMLWDLAGSEEFSTMRASYLRGASGAVLVCDLTRPESLESVHRYAIHQLSLNPEARLILTANKHDLAGQHRLTEEQIKAAADNLSIPYYLTSARTGAQVDDMFRRLGQLLL